MIDLYNQTVGHGSQLMLGIAPDNTGRVAAADVARLKEFGEAVRKLYGHNLVTEMGPQSAAWEAIDDDPETFWSAPAGSHHATIEVTFAQPVTFDRAMTMEWLNDGQRVQKYAIEVLEGTQWKRVAEGQAIGHKKIDIFPAVTAQKVRLKLLSTSSEAQIREFQLFNGAPSH
jgi:alpha-L-fucosidase